MKSSHCPLLFIHPLQDAVAAECSALRWGDFKPRLADALIAHLEPIQTKYNHLMSDPAYIDGVLEQYVVWFLKHDGIRAPDREYLGGEMKVGIVAFALDSRLHRHYHIIDVASAR